jgi:low temperature requirement protein LtrA
MNKKLLIGILVLFVGLMIAAVVSGQPRFFTLGIVVPVIVLWIYFVWMVRKKKTNIFHDQMEPKLAERRYKMLKVFLLVAVISLAVGIVGVILHNVLSALLEKEEAVSFVIGLVGLFVFVIATIGGLVVYLIGRRKPT